MRNVPKILCFATMVLALLVQVQGVWHIIPLELRGVTSDPKVPTITLFSVVDGSWQEGVDKYVKIHFGFREHAIRLYNQYVWSCYHRSLNKSVIPGRDGYLYERYFVEDYYESRMYKYTDNPEELRHKFEMEAKRLAQLQELLRERGTTLFVAVLPGKDMLYPEHLPPADTLNRTPGPRAYPEYLKLFNQYGVQYVDIMGWFKEIRDSVTYDLMTQNGTHWSNIAATYAFDSIMRYMQHIGGAPIRPVRIGQPYYDKTREPDNDLAQLLNLVVTPGQPPCKYVDVSMADTTRGKPAMVVIGDSFFWTVTYNYPLDSLFLYTHYWFYNSTVYFDPEHDNTSQLDLRKVLDDADYVMLNYCSGQLYDLGNGFIVDALVKMLYTDEEIQVVRDNICAEIRSNENWLHNLEDKAANEGITLEQAVLNDANYLMANRPEEYFDRIK
ncbi:MAG: alginate O-acetyltransferase AlgX-related protein [bacterium]